MAYKLLTEIGWEDGYYRKYYCQSATDLASLPTSPTIAIGSEAVLENGSVYRLSNANTWLIFSAATSVSTNAGKSSASVTRPDNAAPFGANDVVGGLLTFANVLPAIQQFILTGANLRVDLNAVTAGMGGFKLHLFDAQPAALADNDVFNIAAADRTKYIGAVQLSAPVDLGDTLWSGNDNINLNGKLVSTSLYGYLTTDNVYTPTALAVKTVTLYTIGV